MIQAPGLLYDGDGRSFRMSLMRFGSLLGQEFQLNS
jgi:hypothetical protein